MLALLRIFQVIAITFIFTMTFRALGEDFYQYKEIAGFDEIAATDDMAPADENTAQEISDVIGSELDTPAFTTPEPESYDPGASDMMNKHKRAKITKVKKTKKVAKSHSRKTTKRKHF